MVLNWAVGVIWWCPSVLLCVSALWNGNFINMSRVTSGCWRRISRICRLRRSLLFSEYGTNYLSCTPISVMWSILRILEKEVLFMWACSNMNSRCIIVASCKAWSDSLHAWDMTWILWTVSKSVTDGEYVGAGNSGSSLPRLKTLSSCKTLSICWISQE